MRVYIWGTGKKAKEYVAMNEINDVLVGFIETNKSNNTFGDYPVYEPGEVALQEYTYIIVLVHDHTKEIFNTAISANLDIERFVFVDNWEWIDGKSMRNEPPKIIHQLIQQQPDYNKLQRLFPRLFEEFIDRDYQKYSLLGITRKNAFDLVDESLITGKDFDGEIYNEDYFRFRTFEFVANEIIKGSLGGEVAELGVFRGDFARLINKKFPMKTLYLFDTFESFDEEEFARDFNNGYCGYGFKNAFRDTSVELVMNRMPNKEQCIVKKGLFPDSTYEMDDIKFCFVSLDVDLENSTYEGLCYFYPRVVDGGYIFIHDYNTRQLQGVKKAVERFEGKYGRLHKVPMADSGGTLIISK